MSSKPAGVFISMSVPSRYVQKCAPWSMTPLRNASPWTRLPMSRPCMSVIATTIGSMGPWRQAHGPIRFGLGSSGSGELAGRLLELLLDRGELGLGAHDPWALEPRLRPGEVIDQQDQHDPDHERPRDVAARREAEQRHEHEDPGNGNPRDR